LNEIFIFILGFCKICHFNNEIVNIDGKLKPFGPIKQEDDEEKENSERQTWTGFVYERGISYRVGDAVFLTPKASNESGESSKSGQKRDNDIDETTYPEYYRKTTHVKGSNEKTPNPFDIAIILEIYSPKLSKDRVKLRVRNLYRPYQVCPNFSVL
jgi:hypothetical protein